MAELGMQYRADIDGLRAVAVLPVVSYHAGIGPAGGFAGVDIFFVISGFLITSIIVHDLEHHKLSLLRFYEKRIRRLFPALFAMILITTFVASFILLPGDLVKYSKSAIAALAFVSNFYFYSDIGYFNESADLKPLLHTWSLGVEEQFYLLAPLALAVFYRFLPRWSWLCLIGLAVGISFGLGIWLGGHAAGFYLPFARAWELGIGMLLALFAQRITISRIFVADLIGLVSVALIFGTYFTVSDMTAWPGVAALAPVLGATGIIVAGTHPNALVARSLSKAPIVFFGKISYSLYLWHWPLIVLVGYGAFRPFNTFESLLLIVSAILIATLSWRWIEEPIRQRRVLRSPNVMFGSGLASALLLVSGLFLVVDSKGFPDRVDPELFDRWQVSDLANDFKIDDCHGLNAARVRQGDICLFGGGGQPSR
jgi:peptidoglycan/LPS O-acetylase OafA/YrhL